eukprot:3306195-Pyramimonas_sp.AAC.1
MPCAETLSVRRPALPEPSVSAGAGLRKIAAGPGRICALEAKHQKVTSKPSAQVRRSKNRTEYMEGDTEESWDQRRASNQRL